MVLTTDRLVLREFTAADGPAVLLYQNDPLYLRYYEWTERTPADVKNFIEMWLKQRQASPRRAFQLAITLRQNGELIGNCGVRQEANDGPNATIGYELNPRYWGRGYATEAGRAMLAFSFGQLLLHRIWATCVAENIASVAVLERLGMRTAAGECLLLGSLVGHAYLRAVKR
ncbi:MAG: GNAT family N-acetyltransferase [Candidatus Promineifilaceae bacterium]|nr:GNAT family N-acetyltransferase [Candidatus Promineifilaceae bacterium]